MLSFKPDKNKKTALYLQIADRIRTLIMQGYYNAGEVLSERSIALKAGVSRNTVTRAFDILREYGYIDSQERYSTKIAEGIEKLAGSDIDWQRMINRSTYKKAPSFFTQKIKENVEDSQSSNINVVRFNAEEYRTRELFSKIVKSVKAEDIQRMFTVRAAQGLPELRHEVAHFLKNYGIHARPSNIIIFANTADALSCASIMLLSPNSVILNQEKDGSEDYTPISQSRVARVNVKSDHEGMIPEELKKQIDRNAGRNRVLLIAPVNHLPTGVTMTAERMAEIASICRHEKIPIIEVDMLRDVYAVEPPRPFAAQSPESVVYLGGPAIFSEVGVTFAWAVVPDSLIFRMSDTKYVMYGGNRTWEIFAWKLFEGGRYERFLDTARKTCIKRNEKVNKLLSKYFKGSATWDPDAALFKTVTLSDNVSIDRAVLEKYESTSYSKIYSSAQNQIFMDLISPSMAELEALIADIGTNYVKFH